MKNLVIQAKTSEVNLSNRIQEAEERISDIEVKIEEMDTSKKMLNLKINSGTKHLENNGTI